MPLLRRRRRSRQLVRVHGFVWRPGRFQPNAPLLSDVRQYQEKNYRCRRGKRSAQPSARRLQGQGRQAVANDYAAGTDMTAPYSNGNDVQVTDNRSIRSRK